jgi:GNAT superfamily N-acetyltransferase
VAVVRRDQALLGEALIEPAELGELEAFWDFFSNAPSDLGAVAEEVGGALCTSVLQAPGSALFNRALGLGLRRAATEADVDAIVDFFDARGVEYGIALHPDARPAELPVWLEARGLRPGYAWAKFSRPVSSPPQAETAFHVERVGPERAADFASVFTRAYGTPAFTEPWLAVPPGRAGWHCFVAYDGETPAATGALHVTGTVGWLGMAGTLPEHRRKGAQGAILAARIEAAAETGCHVVVTETGALEEGRPSNSYRNIVRAGFEEQYVRANYLSSPAADTSGRP